MPTVGKKKFPYTAAGKKSAGAAAKKTGLPLVEKEPASAMKKEAFLFPKKKK